MSKHGIKHIPTRDGGRVVAFPKGWQETNRGADTPERTLSWSVSPGTPIPPAKEHTVRSK